MLDNERTTQSISEDLGVSTATVYRYIGYYQTGGIESLL